MGDIRDEAAVLFVEDVLFLAGEEEVGEGFAHFVGDIGEAEGLFLAVRAGDDDVRERLGGRGGDVFAPGEVGLLVAGHGDQALQGEVFVKGE